MAKKKKNLKQSNLSNAQRRKAAAKRQRDMNAAAGKGMSRSRANTIVMVVVVVALISAIISLVVSQNSGTDNRQVVIHDGDGGIARIDLPADETREFATSKGRNVVVIAGNEVRVSESDCSDQTCVSAGAITEVDQQLICKEHDFWLEIVPRGEESKTMDESAVPGASADNGGQSSEGEQGA